MASGPWNIPATHRGTGSSMNHASFDSSSPLSLPIRPSPRRATLHASRERLSSASVYEPRIVSAESYGNSSRDPACLPESPTASTSSTHPAISRRPSVGPSTSIGRSPSSIGPRRRSIGQGASTSFGHGPHVARHPPHKQTTTSRPLAFNPPSYLDHSILRFRMVTEPQSEEHPEPKPFPSTSRRRMVVPSDSEDDDDDLSPPPTLRTSFNTPIYTRPADSILRLPSRWSEDSRHRSLNVSTDGRDITFSHSGSSGPEETAASVRANYPIPPACGVYYYEVLILKAKGGNGAGGKAHISVGFSSPSAKIPTLPGWEENTWGYHGDDGNAFGSSAAGVKYGPTFGGRDVIGCGINFATQQAFFTKNGNFLNHAFSNLPLSGKDPLLLYPSVGLQRTGDSIQVNFGQSPFMFDIDNYAQQAKEGVWKTRQDADELRLETVGKHFSKVLPERMKEEKRLLEHLVLDYLEHHGYVETANVFKESSKTDLGSRDVSMDVDGVDETANIVRRTNIVNAVRQGDIDAALEGLQRWFPTVLRSDTSIMEDKLSEQDTMWLKLRCRKFVEMILHSVDVKKGKKSAVDGMEVDDWSSVASDDALQRAISYGQNLQSDYRQASDSDPAVRDLFNRTFGIVAFPDPLEAGGLVAEVAGVHARYTLAEEVRTSILKSQGLSTQAVLETIYRRTSVCLAELAMVGEGSAAYVDLKKEFGPDGGL